MDPRDRASRRLFAGLPGPELDGATERALGELQPAGVTLFDRNLRSPSQIRDLVTGIREVCREPVLVAVDQEGGPVNRLRRADGLFALLPDARSQAAWSDDRRRSVWTAVGAALRALGFDIDFAPVVDVDRSDGANAIGPRAFGDDPSLVVGAARSVLSGLDASGIAGCLKHFPGLGGTTVDTHLALAVSPVTRQTFERTHGVPFRELSAEAPLVMTAHAHYPALSAPEPIPATFSRAVVVGLLRDGLGYRGVVVSDDLEMGAVRSFGDPGERAVRALQAGCDLALFCGGLDAPRRARDTLLAALRDGRVDEGEHAESVARIGRLLSRIHLDPPGPAPIGDWVRARGALEAVLSSMA